MCGARKANDSLQLQHSVESWKQPWKQPGLGGYSLIFKVNEERQQKEEVGLYFSTGFTCNLYHNINTTNITANLFYIFLRFS